MKSTHRLFGAKEVLRSSGFANHERTVLDALLRARVTADTSPVRDRSERTTDGRRHPEPKGLTTDIDRMRIDGTERLDGVGAVRDEHANVAEAEDGRRENSGSSSRRPGQNDLQGRAVGDGLDDATQDPSGERSLADWPRTASNGAREQSATVADHLEVAQELIAWVDHFRRHSHGLTEALTVASAQPSGSSAQADTNGGGVDQATAEISGPGSQTSETSLDPAGRRKPWYERGEADRADQLVAADLAPQGPRRADDIGVDGPRPWRFEASPD